MGQLLEGDDDPDLSEYELQDIGKILLTHALATSQDSLAASILSRFPDIVGTNHSQLNQDAGQSDGSGIPTRPSTAPKKLLVEENTAGQEVEMVIQPTHQPLPHHGQ